MEERKKLALAGATVGMGAISLLAASATLFASMYLWLGVLLFQEHISKDEMIGIGLFGTAAIYSVTYLILLRRGPLD